MTITTDVVKATFDSQGGTLVRLELLGFKDAVDPKKHVVLMERNPGKRIYMAQTGLVAPQPGVALPNHYTQMTVLPGERTSKDHSTIGVHAVATSLSHSTLRCSAPTEPACGLRRRRLFWMSTSLPKLETL